MLVGDMNSSSRHRSALGAQSLPSKGRTSFLIDDILNTVKNNSDSNKSNVLSPPNFVPDMSSLNTAAFQSKVNILYYLNF